MPTAPSSAGTEMDHYLAGLLDAKGGFQIRRTTQLVYLVLDFGGNPEIPLLLRDAYGAGTEYRGRWIITRPSELRLVLERVAPLMHHSERAARAERVLVWAQTARFRSPQDPMRAAAFAALA